jgi:hypothetical protein
MADELSARLDETLEAPRTEPAPAFIRGVRRRRAARRVRIAGTVLLLGVVGVVLVMQARPGGPQPVDRTIIAGDPEPELAPSPSLRVLTLLNRSADELVLPRAPARTHEVRPVRLGSPLRSIDPEGLVDSL